MRYDYWTQARCIVDNCYVYFSTIVELCRFLKQWKNGIYYGLTCNKLLLVAMEVFCVLLFCVNDTFSYLSVVFNVLKLGYG